MLFVYQPKHLLIDEIEQLSSTNYSMLNSLMATGIISEMKHNKTRQAHLDTKAFAAGIKTQKLPGDLQSRFTKLYFDTYAQKQFLEVTSAILTDEGASEKDALYIGEEIWNIYGGQLRYKRVRASLKVGDNGYKWHEQREDKENH